jgi:peptidoglycan/LPS O-acetylase OafA/YrhL
MHRRGVKTPELAMSNAPYKFGFADFLRGPAAPCVLIAHIIGNVMGWPSSMFFLGQLGVAMFFLVSGFVISISLTKYNIQGFLLARILRIYPTYAVALTVTLVCVWIPLSTAGRLLVNSTITCPGCSMAAMTTFCAEIVKQLGLCRHRSQLPCR